LTPALDYASVVTAVGRRGINGELKTYQEQKAEADEYERKLTERDEAVVTKTLWKLFLYQQTMEKARNKIASHQEELKEHKRSVEKYHNKHEQERQAEAKVKRDVTKTDRSIKDKEKEMKRKSIDEMTKILDSMINDRVQTGGLVIGANGVVRPLQERRKESLSEIPSVGALAATLRPISTISEAES
jgi:alpha-galactosidase/6-phospho-beta-glucosidase family protein